ncbi:hypothetical protein NEF87_000012 [Candidatus Lokiarchaeum ossiferum]|uniref:DUF998 domain-containing protein n=1 Tax=Candidatus Lokiarchaeum ossiferum TaxID=2951803 RepID=A0ABY6HJL1_9ARCH|nr:hypothetical protein NEF87_000012 [Candidatus Lokiarchaeum sp. B-35]
MKLMTRWKIFWMSITICTILLVYALNKGFILSKNNYIWPAIIFFIGEYISLGLAHKFASYNHQITKNPISFLGQLNAKGKSNVKSAVLFIGFSISYGGIVFLLANLISTMYPNNVYLIIISYVLLGVVVAVIMMTLIPIDVSRILHLFATAFWLGLYLGANIAIVNFLFYIQQFNITIPSYYLVACGFHIISAIIYLIAYFTHYRASLFQKIWIFASNISLLFTIDLFARLL